MAKFKMKKLIFPALVLVIFSLMSWVMLSNYQTIGELREQGKQPATTVATPLVPQNGRDGKDATPEQVYEAVKTYCQANNCGNVAYQTIVSAVYTYCLENNCVGAKGEQGQKGADAPAITSSQIQEAVNLYCAGGNCKGADGQDGAVGATGAKGEPVVLHCVIRTTNTLDTKYIAWKYQTEADVAYRDLYKLPAWAECSSPIDLRTT